MNDYEIYVKEINNIFSIIEKIKKEFNNADNLSYVDDIISYRDDVLSCASLIEKSLSKKEVNDK